MEDILIEKLRVAEFSHIDHWCIGLYEDHNETATDDVGIQNLWIKQYDLINENIQSDRLYVIEIETIANMANWKHGQDAVLNKLVLKPRYETGEFVPYAAFSLEEDAIKYANKHFPYVDKTEIIMKYYNNA